MTFQRFNPGPDAGERVGVILNAAVVAKVDVEGIVAKLTADNLLKF
jgi:hypothetical protein